MSEKTIITKCRGADISAFSVIALHLFTIIEMDDKYAFLFEIILFKKAFPDVTCTTLCVQHKKAPMEN